MKCRIEEINGFLKETCQGTNSILSNYKCPFTEEYYYVVTAGFIANGQHPLVNATCSDDPYGYQVISFVGKEKFLNP